MNFHVAELPFLICYFSNFFCQIKLRGYLSHVRHMFVGYWGIHSVKLQSATTLGLPSPRAQDASDDAQQPAEASGIGRSWVQSMFTRDTSIRAKSFSRVGKWTSDNSTLGM